jgi:hypothetical protein
MMVLSALIRPRTRRWGKAKAALEEYVGEQQAKQRQALGLARLAQVESDTPRSAGH